MTDINKDDFASQCVTMALQFGINAHYLAGVAMLRSKLKDDVVNNQFGPYLWTQAEWDANPDRSNPALGRAFPSNAIKDWRAQVSVFALMAQRDYAILQATLGQSPTAIQLYQKQWPSVLDPPLSTDLQKACDDTKQAILDAINDQMPDPTAAASVITDPKKPVAPQSQTGGDSSGGGGAGGAGGKPRPTEPQPKSPDGSKPTNVASPDRDLSLLHPMMRVRAQKVLAACAQQQLPFRIFEAWRAPERQQYLYEQGRSRSGGIVTYSRAWESYHQYGLAADFVLYYDGKPNPWSWDDTGSNKPLWDTLHQIGRGFGLEPLGFETPHLQVAGLRI